MPDPFFLFAAFIPQSRQLRRLPIIKLPFKPVASVKRPDHKSTSGPLTRWCFYIAFF
ncbi:MAG: hypothetical protein PHX16_07165 [Syntrophaceticus sp.]|nr:hypothetical protein [Syntrophaceticus sp.]MDD3314624.1 hypothetical protein [Syntrophaceticus sp.]MDD4360495.1 hypothetical protein [Syntrophaceticus sp.]MDD4783398.1 hypothetical protein [Syntrophaceticus sp.]